MYTIMVIDDDESIGNMEQELLEREGYQVQRAFSGTEALLLLKQKRPNLILLDLMLPGMSGEKVLSQIQGIPIIVVSAKTDADSKVNLLLGGAVDYLTKPFDTKELLARINIRLRESMRTTQFPIYNYGELNIDETSRKVSLEDKTVNLTRTEFAILKLLVQNPGQVIAKSVLLDRISLDTPDCTENSLKMQHVTVMEIWQSAYLQMEEYSFLIMLQSSAAWRWKNYLSVFIRLRQPEIQQELGCR